MVFFDFLSVFWNQGFFSNVSEPLHPDYQMSLFPNQDEKSQIPKRTTTHGFGTADAAKLRELEKEVSCRTEQTIYIKQKLMYVDQNKSSINTLMYVLYQYMYHMADRYCVGT